MLALALALGECIVLVVSDTVVYLLIAAAISGLLLLNRSKKAAETVGVSRPHH